MNVTQLYGTSQAAAAQALIGGDLIADVRNDLLKQIVVAVANKTSSPGGGGGASNALLLAGATASTLGSLTAATADTGGLLYGTQGGADRKFTLTAAGATLVEAANATAQRTALGLGTIATLSSSNPTLFGVTVANGSLTINGNISAAAWTTTGVRIKGTPGTLTDISGAGTVAAAYTNAFSGNTIAASNARTFTNYVTSYHTSPTAGTNVTFTQKWGLGTDLMLVNGNGAASQPALALTGTPFTGGTATTTKPLFSIEPTGATSTAWSTSGTMLGVNAASGFAGMLGEFQLNGASKVKLGFDGRVQAEAGGAFPQFCGIGFTNYGMRVASDRLDFWIAGVPIATIASTGMDMGGFRLTFGGGVQLNQPTTNTLALQGASATPITMTLSGAPAVGTDITGGTLNIGTRGTGTGTGGRINLQYHAAGSSGSTLGTLVDVLSIVGAGRVRITGIPTSAAGLSTGDIYSNAGILTII